MVGCFPLGVFCSLNLKKKCRRGSVESRGGGFWEFLCLFVMFSGPVNQSPDEKKKLWLDSSEV